MITGGASGIGKNAAEMIVLNGGKVIISDINPEGKLVADKLGKNALFFQTDVSERESICRKKYNNNNKMKKLMKNRKNFISGDLRKVSR